MAIDFPSTINKIEENGYVMLPIFPEHTVCVASLPFQHEDPFDRILNAQTIVKKLKIISKDDNYDTYGIDLLW
jgi:PIN domain nuclease of toxin-antitoxin system